MNTEAIVVQQYSTNSAMAVITITLQPVDTRWHQNHLLHRAQRAEVLVDHSIHKCILTTAQSIVTCDFLLPTGKKHKSGPQTFKYF